MIEISSFTYREDKNDIYFILNGNISSQGTIVINNNFYNRIKDQISSNWEIILK